MPISIPEYLENFLRLFGSGNQLQKCREKLFRLIKQFFCEFFSRCFCSQFPEPNHRKNSLDLVGPGPSSIKNLIISFKDRGQDLSIEVSFYQDRIETSKKERFLKYLLLKYKIKRTLKISDECGQWERFVNFLLNESLHPSGV